MVCPTDNSSAYVEDWRILRNSHFVRRGYPKPLIESALIRTHSQDGEYLLSPDIPGGMQTTAKTIPFSLSQPTTLWEIHNDPGSCFHHISPWLLQCPSFWHPCHCQDRSSKCLTQLPELSALCQSLTISHRSLFTLIGFLHRIVSNTNSFCWYSSVC
jgi:hypothetical protein